MIRRIALRAVPIAVALVGLSSNLVAQQVSSRAALNGLLSSSTIETFSGIPVGFGGQAIVSGPSVNNATDARFVAGVTYTSAGPATGFGSNLYVPGNGYFGFASQAFLAGSNTLRITFDNVTSAFGLEFLQYSGFSELINISVFQGSSLLGGCSGCLAPNAPTANFFGWQNAGGITSIELQGGSDWSPIVDDVEWGVVNNTVPEPASLALVGAGLVGIVMAGRRRKQAKSDVV